MVFFKFIYFFGQQFGRTKRWFFLRNFDFSDFRFCSENIFHRKNNVFGNVFSFSCLSYLMPNPCKWYRVTPAVPPVSAANATRKIQKILKIRPKNQKCCKIRIYGLVPYSYRYKKIRKKVTFFPLKRRLGTLFDPQLRGSFVQRMGLFCTALVII